MQTSFGHTAILAIAFALFWFGGAALMSRIAGWHALNALYPAPTRLRAEEFRFCTATVGAPAFPITYRRCVRVLFTESGFGLCLMIPFRFHSPPFLVPWASVTGCTERQFLATRKVTFTVAGTQRQVTFAAALGQEMKARYLAHTQGTQASRCAAQDLP